MSFPQNSKISPSQILGSMHSSTEDEVHVSICEFSDCEEKIRNPDDEEVFLSASMAFLTKMITKRIEEKLLKRSFCTGSDVLLIANNQNELELVQLQNVKLNKKVFQNEACKAKRALSFDVMLPQPIRKTCNNRLVNFINSSLSRISLSSNLSRNSLLRLLFKRKKYSANIKAKDDDSSSSPLDDSILSTETSEAELDHKYSIRNEKNNCGRVGLVQTTLPPINIYRKALNAQQSKLSFCTEEEEDDSDNSEWSPSNMSTNFTDEYKSKHYFDCYRHT